MADHVIRSRGLVKSGMVCSREGEGMGGGPSEIGGGGFPVGGLPLDWGTPGVNLAPLGPTAVYPASQQVIRRK